MTIQTEIQAILDGAGDHRAGHHQRSRDLHRLACRLRDADDIAGFDTVVAEIARHPHPRRPDEKMDSFRPSPSFRLMYDGRNKVLVAREKHGTSYFDITHPDAFARATLGLVQDRLKIGMYQAPVLHPSGRAASIMIEKYIEVILKDPVIIDATLPARALAEALGATDLYAFARGADASIERVAQMVVDLRDDPETNDGALATLVWGLQNRCEGDYGHAACALIEARSDRARPVGPVLTRVLGMFGISDEACVKSILRRAHDGEMRTAGRAAWDLLQRRSDAEYEQVTWHCATVPDLQIDTDLLASA